MMFYVQHLAGWSMCRGPGAEINVAGVSSIDKLNVLGGVPLYIYVYNTFELSTNSSLLPGEYPATLRQRLGDDSKQIRDPPLPCAYSNAYSRVRFGIARYLIWDRWGIRPVTSCFLSALLQLHLHSRLNIWLQGIRQRQPRDNTRIFWVFGLVRLILETWRYAYIPQPQDCNLSYRISLFTQITF